MKLKLIFLLFGATFLFSEYICFKFYYPKYKLTHPQTWFDQQIANRIFFQEKYENVSGLIDDYLNQKNVILSIFNPTSSSITTNNNFSFTTLKSFDKLIASQKFNNDQEKFIWLNNYIKKITPFTHSLYLSYNNSQQNASSLLSSFGTGECGFGANIMAILASHLGYQTKIWSLTGHGVIEIYYNNSWHMFDPQFIGYIFNQNKQIADIDYVIKLAKENKLSVFNYEFATTQDNKLYSLQPENYLDKKNNLINLYYYPNENKSFLSTLYLLTTSSDYLDINSRYLPNKFLTNYQNKIGNIIREIPIASLNSKNNDYIEINDFFPIIGLFLINNEPMRKTLQIKADIIFSEAKFANGYHFQPHKYFGKIIDYTYLLPNLSDHYANTIGIGNLKKTQQLYPNSKLIIVTQYSIHNTDFNNLEIISKESKLATTRQQ